MKNNKILFYLIIFVLMHIGPFSWLGWAFIFDGKILVGITCLVFMLVFCGKMIEADYLRKDYVPQDKFDKYVKSLVDGKTSIVSVKRSDEEILKKLFEED